MNKPSAIFLSMILAGLASVFCCGPVFAATVLVRPGDTLERLAHTHKVSPVALAQANNLKPAAPLKPGTVLTLPGPAGEHAGILPPDANAHEIIAGKPVPGVKGLNAAPQQNAAVKGKDALLMPEMRPAVDALTPGSAIAREPKTYDRTAPGITATLHPGSNTEILGVFNLPGSTTTSTRPYGLPENAPQNAPSGGVMLKRTF